MNSSFRFAELTAATCRSHSGGGGKVAGFTQLKLGSFSGSTTQKHRTGDSFNTRVGTSPFVFSVLHGELQQTASQSFFSRVGWGRFSNQACLGVLSFLGGSLVCLPCSIFANHCGIWRSPVENRLLSS